MATAQTRAHEFGATFLTELDSSRLANLQLAQRIRPLYSFGCAGARNTSTPLQSGGNPLRRARGLLRPILVLRSGIHDRQQLRPLEPPECRFRHLQQLPDHRCGILDLLETLGGRRAQSHRGKGRLDYVRGPEVRPVFTRELIEGDETFPIIGQPLHGFGCRLRIAVRELFPRVSQAAWVSA